MAVAAGSVALPTLLKLSEVLTAQKQDLNIGHQLPVEVELGKVGDNTFYKVFSVRQLQSHRPQEMLSVFQLRGRAAPGCALCLAKLCFHTC